MIRKLRRKLVILSMTCLVVLLTVIVVIMNGLNYRMVIGDADEILDMISQNRGRFPDPEETQEETSDSIEENSDTDEKDENKKENEKENEKEDHGRSPIVLYPELPYESRFFSVVMAADGTVVSVDLAQISTVDEAMAVDYAQQVLSEGAERGFADRFRFLCSVEGAYHRVTFLDWSHKMSILRNFVFVSFLMMIVGTAVLFILVAFFSGRIIRPIAESYEKQKRFITDAGHEMKTPLTVIGANADLLEMEIGRNEAVDDIRKETERLTNLTNDLVYLARMEEAERTLQKIDFPISEIVRESLESFSAPARLKGISVKTEIPDELSFRGNPAAILRLVSLLMDNAVKYSPENGQIRVSLSLQARAVVLSMENDTKEAVRRSELSRLFDRFYRADPSRSSAVKGHGIGLSTAKAIVVAHGGRIRAWSNHEKHFGITVNLPL